MEIKVKLTDGAPLPKHVRVGDAGMDLTSRETVEIVAGGTVKVGTGVWMEIPEGYYGEIVPRSGVASKRGITLANTPATIDSNYRGEIMLPLHNISPVGTWELIDPDRCEYRMVPNVPAIVERGERVAQIIIKRHETCECVEVNELSETERAANGFGSSGTM